MHTNVDYACSSWYQNLTKKLKDSLKTTQSEFLRFWLKLGYIKRIKEKECKQQTIETKEIKARKQNFVNLCKLYGFQIYYQ